MQLAPGTRLRSQTCTTEVMVIKGAALPDDLTCGGSPMVTASSASAEGSAQAPAPGLDTGSLLGKRYGNGALEVLVTKAGAGTLAVGSQPLDELQARQLPSSD